MQPAYVSLLELIEGWAAQSGQSPVAVLQHIHDHANKGSIEVRTVLHSVSGHYVGEVIIDTLSKQAASKNKIVQRNAWSAIEEILVVRASILKFCKGASVRPPPCATTNTNRLLSLHAKHLAPPPTDQFRRELTVSAERKCRKWLIQLMTAGPPEKNKPEYEIEAKSEFGVSAKAFQRAWSVAVEETGNKDWNKPGKKPIRQPNS